MSRNIVAFRDLVQDRFPGEKKWNARVMDVFWDWIEKRVLEESDDEQDEEEEDEEEEEEEESDAQEDDYEEESPVPKTPPQTNGKVSAKASQRSSKVGPPPKSAKKAPTVCILANIVLRSANKRAHSVHKDPTDVDAKPKEESKGHRQFRRGVKNIVSPCASHPFL